jgi:hypothetical protein
VMWFDHGVYLGDWLPYRFFEVRYEMEKYNSSIQSAGMLPRYFWRGGPNAMRFKLKQGCFRRVQGYKD